MRLCLLPEENVLNLRSTTSIVQTQMDSFGCLSTAKKNIIILLNAKNMSIMSKWTKEGEISQEIMKNGGDSFTINMEKLENKSKCRQLSLATGIHSNGVFLGRGSLILKHIKRIAQSGSRVEVPNKILMLITLSL